MERISKMVDDSFIIAVFDSMKDETKNYETQLKMICVDYDPK